MAHKEHDASPPAAISQPPADAETTTSSVVRRALRWTDSRHQILQRIAGGAPVEEICVLLTARAEELFPDSICTVMLLDDEGACVNRVFAVSLGNEIRDSLVGFEIGPDAASCGRAMSLGEQVIVEDTEVSPIWEGFRDFAREAGIRACWSTPIRTKDGVIRGSMAVTFSTPHAPAQDDLRVIEAHSQLAGIAIDAALSAQERRRTRDALQQSRANLVGLLEASAALQQVTDEQAVLQLVAEAVHRAGWGSVVVCQFERWETTHMACVGLSDDEIRFIDENQPRTEQRAAMYGEAFAPYRISRSYFLTADEVRARDDHDDRPFMPTQLLSARDGDWDPCDVAYVPMYGEDDGVIGTISLDDPVDGRRPDIDTFRYLEFFADMAARTLERLRLIRSLVQAEERLLLMMRELDHRVRNNLTSLIALVHMMGSSAATPSDMEAALTDRIQAMADVHMLLSQSSWKPVPISELFRAFRPPRLTGDIRCSGPELLVPARQAGALGMVIHELMMNSIKYGALGTVGGLVDIKWSSSDLTQGEHRAEISWEERGVEIDGERIEPGLGTKLIEGLVHFELDGHARLSYRDDGASHLLSISLDRV